MAITAVYWSIGLTRNMKVFVNIEMWVAMMMSQRIRKHGALMDVYKQEANTPHSYKRPRHA
jgi:hypothetical protein